MECTCLAMALEIGHDILEKRGVETPHHVVFKYDNTAREGKNQIMAKFEVGAVHSPRQTRQCRSNSGERQRREEELRIPEHCQEIHCLQSGLKMVCKHEQ